jgi:hypothetical protein
MIKIYFLKKKERLKQSSQKNYVNGGLLVAEKYHTSHAGHGDT